MHCKCSHASLRLRRRCGTAPVMAADWDEAIERAQAHAPFLARGLEKHDELSELMRNGAGEAAVHVAAEIGEIEHALQQLEQALPNFKQALTHIKHPWPT